MLCWTIISPSLNSYDSAPSKLALHHRVTNIIHFDAATVAVTVKDLFMTSALEYISVFDKQNDCKQMVYSSFVSFNSNIVICSHYRIIWRHNGAATLCKKLMMFGFLSLRGETPLPPRQNERYSTFFESSSIQGRVYDSKCLFTDGISNCLDASSWSLVITIQEGTLLIASQFGNSESRFFLSSILHQIRCCSITL